MAAYIVGMITGALCMIAPLVYLGNVNVCVATILSNKPETLDQFTQTAPVGLMYAIVVVGAVVFLLSAGMAAFTGAARIRGTRKPEPEEPAPSDEEVEMPEI